MTIPAEIQARREPLATLCRLHHVRRLDLFGSALNERFDPTSSDLDFLVEYLDVPEARTAAAYFDLLAGLRDLFGHPVDLVELAAIRNPYFLRAVTRDRATLYAA